MISVDGVDYYTAAEAAEILCMKYSSTIYLFRENDIQKFDNKYIITKEELEKLKNRKNQYIKTFHITEENLMYGDK